jgi:8-oxo-dGTP diphosphatase
MIIGDHGSGAMATGEAEGDFERPIVTVDLVIFTLGAAELEVLVLQRGAEPEAGSWALPGGFVHVDEDADLEAAARRVLAAKTGIAAPYLEQLQAFGDPARDPRGWSVSISYMALLARAERAPHSGTTAWVPASGATLLLAFDHARILAAAVTRLRNKVEYTTLPAHLLPDKFTLPDLQRVYERILGRPLDKSAFRKRVAEADFLEEVAGEKRPASNRPAQLYRLKAKDFTVFFNRTL